MFNEIEEAFQSGDRQKIEMMAREILCRRLSHPLVEELSERTEQFSSLLLQTDPIDKEYLALVYILNQYLQDVHDGECACTIVNMPMFNCPSRLSGILEILEKKSNKETWTIWVHSKCRACGVEYESERLPSGHGERVLWSKIS